MFEGVGLNSPLGIWWLPHVQLSPLENGDVATLALGRLEQRLEQDEPTLDLLVAASGVRTTVPLLPGLGGGTHPEFNTFGLPVR